MDGYIIVGRTSYGKLLYSKPCVLCGKPVRALAQAIRQGKGRYCGLSCSGKANRAKRRRVLVTTEERFWSKVDKSGPVPPHRPRLGKCWLWTGYRLPFGQGTLRIGGRSGRHHPAPRIHKCDNPSCVRASHLFLGTPRDNVHDMLDKGRGRTVPPQRKTRLTAAEVREIRALRASGTGAETIARRFQISVYSTRDIVARRTWKHVE
jgi:hypothetical protein